MKFIKALVLVSPTRPDYVYLYPDQITPSPFPLNIPPAPLIFQFQAMKGHGIQYVRDNFGLEAEVQES